VSEPDQAVTAQASLADAVEALDEGFALFDDTARLRLCNARFREIYAGLAAMLVPGASWELLLREAVSRGLLDAAAARRLRTTEARLDPAAGVEPLEIAAPGGRVVVASLSATRAGGFVLTLRDVTARRRLEAREREADLLLRKVLEACPANVLMSRVADGAVIYRSPPATELLGPVGRHAELFAEPTAHADFIAALLPEGRVEAMPAVLLRPDGTAFPATISARMIADRGEAVVVSTVTDLSREAAMQAELAEQRATIFQTEKMSALGELLAGVAHELNNPLSVVVGQALMLREDVDDPAIVRRLDKIGAAAERCARIVKSFLAIARQQPASLAPAELDVIVATGVDAMRNGPTGLTATVEVALAGDLPRIAVDADQIAQVVVNLVGNADQAIASSGRGGLIRVSTRHDAPAAIVELRVTDDGPGIPEPALGRVFDPLFSTREAGKGAGIGLALCHRIVTAHRGTIRTEPSPGGGATFVVRLPVAAVAAALPGPRRRASGLASEVAR
jgi:signal transduction histidine kinase